MTEPDDRPGSDDPEDPSELQRLIGRTVPRSPHASARPAPDDHATAEPGRPHGRSGEPGNSDEAGNPGEPGNSEEPGNPSEAGNPEEPGNPGEPGNSGEPDPTGPDTAARAAVSAPASGGDGPGPEDGDVDDPEAAEDPPDDLPPDDLAGDVDLEHALEALLLVVDSPVDEPALATTLNQPASRIRATLNRMSLAYTADARGIDLRRAGEGWRFYTRDRYAPYVEKMLLDGQRARLTRAALETLAVVAYRQPVTRARVSAVRGVNCDGVLRTLLTRGLVEEAGTEEQTGGTLFRTTELFLERLGLSSVAELPPLAPLLPDIDAIDDLDGN